MGKLAIIFPGQGAQTVGMGRDFYERFDAAKSIFDAIGDSVKNATFIGPQDELNQTVNAQPALFAVSLAIAAVLDENDVIADGIAGFSLGEITGLVYCGLLNLEQGIAFVKYRAKAMMDCAIRNEGGMAAVLGLDVDTVIQLCIQVDGAYPANFNSHAQTVVAYRADAYDTLVKAVAAQGGKFIKLAVSGAFHSPLMDNAAADVERYLQNVAWGKPTKPLYANCTAQPYPDIIHPQDMAKQINHPVKWRETIENMITDGYDTFIEAGPGKVLTGMIKKINPGVRVYNIFDVVSLEQTLKEIG